MLTPATRGLIDLMRSAPRGPRRDGLFALWLAVHVAEDLGLATGTAERAYRRRVALLEQRISSLALPLALKRGLARMIEGLKNAPAGCLLALAGILQNGGHVAVELVGELFTNRVNVSDGRIVIGGVECHRPPFLRECR